MDTPIPDLITHDKEDIISIPLTSLPDITDEMQIRKIEQIRNMKNENGQLLIKQELIIKQDFPSAYFQNLTSSDVSMLFVTSDEMTTRNGFLVHGKQAVKHFEKTLFLQQLYDTINPHAEPLTIAMLNAMLSLFTSSKFNENITVII